jgi:branched-chain amino acid transport system ATP-binding protein
MPMLEVSNLVVRYGSILALRGISIEVNEGEIVGVIGPNGAGKSTMLMASAAAIPVAEGDIRFEGESVLGQRPEDVVGRGISLVPEGRHIFHTLNVGENLELGATIRKDSAEVEKDRARVFELFPILKEYVNTPAGKLSGGEQQMLAIGRALLARPRLLMLDEPSLGLAPIVIDRVFETLDELRESGVTILLVEQHAERTLELADRVYVIRTGNIEMSGTPAELAANPQFEQAFLGFV